MLKVFLGFIVGLFTGFVLFVSCLMLGVKFDVPAITNIVIATATVIATFIHYNSIQQQKIQRTWDMNKEHLLNLSRILREANEFTREMADHEFDRIQGINQRASPVSGVDKWQYLSESLVDSLGVFAPILPDSLIKDIDAYKKKSDQINKSWGQTAGQPLFDIYEQHYENQKALSVTLARQIRRLSGTNT